MSKSTNKGSGAPVSTIVTVTGVRLIAFAASARSTRLAVSSSTFGVIRTTFGPAPSTRTFPPRLAGVALSHRWERSPRRLGRIDRLAGVQRPRSIHHLLSGGTGSSATNRARVVRLYQGRPSARGVRAHHHARLGKSVKLASSNLAVSGFDSRTAHHGTLA